MRLRFKLRRLIAKSWILSLCYYPLHGHRLAGRASDKIWYFAYGGANMRDGAFRMRWGIQPLEHRSGHIKVIGCGSISMADPRVEPLPQTCTLTWARRFWGVLYRIARRDLNPPGFDRRSTRARLPSCRGQCRGSLWSGNPSRHLHGTGQGSRWKAIAALHHAFAGSRAIPQTSRKLHSVFGGCLTRAENKSAQPCWITRALRSGGASQRQSRIVRSVGLDYQITVMVRPTRCWSSAGSTLRIAAA
jgi:hypothetical protein